MGSIYFNTVAMMLKYGAEIVPLDQAYRRILTEDVIAAIDVQSFDWQT